eukprot:2005130-Pleurochrysis_carterae.AAC.1
MPAPVSPSHSLLRDPTGDAALTAKAAVLLEDVARNRDGAIRGSARTPSTTASPRAASTQS